MHMGGKVMELVNVKEFAARVQLHPMTVYRLIRDNKLPSVKVGGQNRIAWDIWEERAIKSWVPNES